jgi:hypothetical protein
MRAHRCVSGYPPRGAPGWPGRCMVNSATVSILAIKPVKQPDPILMEQALWRYDMGSLFDDPDPLRSA